MSDCGCDKTNSCEEQKCGCAIELDLACVRNNGEDLDCIDFKKGDNLETFFAKFNETFCDFDPTPSGEACINEVTHAELLNLIDTATLTQGCFYILTDFQTIYDQPDFEYNGVAKTAVDTKSGGIELLLLQATSINKVGEKVKSLTFPKDEIKYDPTWIVTEVMAAPAKGRITERVDVDGNKTDYDHRAVQFKRYEGPGTAFYSIAVDLDGGYEASNFSLGALDTGYGQTTITLASGTVTGPAYLTSNDIVSYINTHTGERAGVSSSFTESGSPFNVTASFANGVLTLYSLAGTGFEENGRGLSLNFSGVGAPISANTVFSGGSSDDYNTVNDDGTTAQDFYTFGTGAKENTIANLLIPTPFLTSNNVFKGAVEGNVAGVNSTNNTFELTAVHNTLGDNAEGNRISTNAQHNIIGAFAKNNIVGNNFKFNNIGYGFDGNSIGADFSANTIGKDFYSNFIKNFFSFNVIENLFYGNVIADDFGYSTEFTTINYIGNDFANNTIGVGFHSNRILRSFSGNTVGVAFTYNNIDSNFKSNTTGDFFINNVIKDGFDGNIIGDNFRYNVIGTGFFSHTILDTFEKNNVAKGINTLDFSSATHVYNDYDCNILVVDGGAYRLFYYDSGFFSTNAAPTT